MDAQSAASAQARAERVATDAAEAGLDRDRFRVGELGQSTPLLEREFAGGVSAGPLEDANRSGCSRCSRTAPTTSSTTAVDPLCRLTWGYYC